MTKKKTSAKKKLLPAIGMLAISGAMLASSTYAWFTMSKEVQVTGMTAHTKVGGNLLISVTNKDEDYSANTLSQTRRALLEPASSINGATNTFYYTTDAKADGSKNLTTDKKAFDKYNESVAADNPTAGKNGYDKAFNDAYNVTYATQDGDTPAYGYVDYIFYLKATSDDDNQVINMTKCDLDYNNSNLNQSGTVGDDVDKAWRVAVYAHTVTEGAVDNTDYAATAGNQKGLIAFDGATYFNDGAVKSQTEYEAISNAASSTGVVIGTIANKNTTAYYKVTVRLWLEGQDKTCNSKTYADLTKDYALDLKFELGQGTAVKNITTDAYSALTDNANTQDGSAYYDKTPVGG